MKLKVKHISIKAGGPLIAILNYHDALKLDVHEGDRVEIKHEKRKVTAVIDIAYNHSDILPGEIGIYNEIVKKIKTRSNEYVNIEAAKKPISLEYIKKKLQKNELNKEEINQIIKDLIENKLSEIEATYFVSGCYINGMTLKESAYLSQAIVHNSKTLHFKKKIIVDKHCVSGVPGNRTTMIVVPIIAAAGLTIPKTSTRSITSAAGTSDTVEVLAPVSHSKERIKEIVNKTNGCMVWGGTLDLASADDMLIKLERPLNLDPEGILLASILAKKSAVDSTHVLIDIPVGPQAKIKTIKNAKSLKKKFVKLGKYLHLKTKVIITPGIEPIGNGIGPALEARDVLWVLENKGPEDLKRKSLHMAAIIMKMVGIKNAHEKAEYILNSGLAMKKMREIIKAQGGDPTITPERIKIGQFHKDIIANKSGKVCAMNIKELTRLAKIAGAPQDKEAGIYMHVKLGYEVKKNQLLFTIYAKHEDKLKSTLESLKLPETIILR